MSEWVSKGGPIGNYWVLDTDGYAYWAAPLLPGQATGLLIHKVELIKKPPADYYYGIFVNAQMASQYDLPNNYEQFLYDATKDGRDLTNKLAMYLCGKITPAP